MKYSAFLVLARRRVGIGAIALSFSLWLGAPNTSAAPCSRTSAQQDAWVARKINALVLAARSAYENDEAQGSYERVLDEIAGTMTRCRLADDHDFVGRHPEFVDYVKVLSLSRDEDHELGFLVSDEVYFAETSKFTSIPDFLLTPRFLSSVSHFETLIIRFSFCLGGRRVSHFAQ